MKTKDKFTGLRAETEHGSVIYLKRGKEIVGASVSTAFALHDDTVCEELARRFNLAPELVEALEKIMGDTNDSLTVVRCREALAKAKGQL